MKILYVEKSKTIRGINTHLLKENGYKDVIEAGNGEDALEKLLQNPDVQLTLLDYELPNMESIETLQAIRKNPANKDILVIMLTSDPGNKVRTIEALRNGACNCWDKPLSIRKIKPELDEYDRKLREKYSQTPT